LLKKLSHKEKEHAVAELKTWFEEERGETIGELGADLLLEVIAEHIAPFYFNQGIRAARLKVDETYSRLAEDLDVLERPSGA
jgi:uncharacterized protein (DUF2164 family)